MNRTELKPFSFLIEECIKLFGDPLFSIVLFGSRARGNYGENSDFDIIIVVNGPGEYRTSELKKKFLINFERRLDFHIFSKKEIIDNFNDYSPLFSTLLLGKKILFDKEMFFKKQFDYFIKKMTSIDIKYCEGNKIWEMRKIAKNLEVLQ